MLIATAAPNVCRFRLGFNFSGKCIFVENLSTIQNYGKDDDVVLRKIVICENNNFLGKTIEDFARKG